MGDPSLAQIKKGVPGLLLLCCVLVQRVRQIPHSILFIQEILTSRTQRNIPHIFIRLRQLAT
jgi:hypothetical protein